MKIINGDLIRLAQEGKFDVIVHGCNCFCTMGAGIAKRIKWTFPKAYEIDAQTKKGDYSKLGTISYAKLPDLIVVNGYTQYNYTRVKCDVEYAAVRSVFSKIKINFSGKRIGYPAIGSGLAGGDWKIIAGIIERELFNEDHTLVVYKPV